ncbi:sulfurtransferase complex subunit TusC [Alginatibacterium sediminis]|uniref:Sulfurtransferase complex subunit TusC n=1 Tax=Alginatibacterium sediminis TaxID=2164068 RepID=A0A420EJL3_9ALTE|nr:sulfurtransferase complex subunit TusC [Alginatibacterium sediminis]RKF20853.1 sulfurtransferase complex subunit TusC [Alginatibacterium sediminis]
MSQLLYEFVSSPHQSANSREGLDAVLAASAVTDDIVVVFHQLGPLQLLTNQVTDQALVRSILPTFKMLDLYDVEAVYVLDTCLQDLGLQQSDLAIELKVLSLKDLTKLRRNAHAILRF